MMCSDLVKFWSVSSGILMRQLDERMRFALFAVFCVISCESKLLKVKDDVLNLIEDAGYQGEAYEVQTNDGYLLRVHRLFPKFEAWKPPVFLMHGILATSADFLLTGADIALGYLLADNGYDVWMGNARGNKYSTNHRNLSSFSNKFWTFSWHEIGFYDLPAMIDFMLKTTKASKAFYAGHSQGTTSLLVMLSMRPEYNDKIIQAHLMAPSAFRKKLPRLRTVLYFFEYLDSMDDFKFLNLSSFFQAQDRLSKFFCREELPRRFRICMNLISSFVGGQRKIEIDTKILPNLTQHLSPRISVMQLTHYYQNMIHDDFRLFDFKEDNEKIYNSTKPPEYNLRNVVAPLHLYHGTNDLYASVKGVRFLADSLPNVQRLQIIDNWSHIDFVYGKNSRKTLYNNFLEAFNLTFSSHLF